METISIPPQACHYIPPSVKKLLNRLVQLLLNYRKLSPINFRPVPSLPPSYMYMLPPVGHSVYYLPSYMLPLSRQILSLLPSCMLTLNIQIISHLLSYMLPHSTQILSLLPSYTLPLNKLRLHVVLGSCTIHLNKIAAHQH